MNKKEKVELLADLVNEIIKAQPKDALNQFSKARIHPQQNNCVIVDMDFHSTCAFSFHVDELDAQSPELLAKLFRIRKYQSLVGLAQYFADMVNMDLSPKSNIVTKK